MTDLNRNTRTLIVAFVVAVLALVPLRFVAEGQDQGYGNYFASEVMVLGTEDYSYEEIILPTAADPVQMSEEAVLEAPYNEIDGVQVLGVSTDEVTGVNCISKENAAGIINQLYEVGASSQDLQFVANSVCR